MDFSLFDTRRSYTGAVSEYLCSPSHLWGVWRLEAEIAQLGGKIDSIITTLLPSARAHATEMCLCSCKLWKLKASRHVPHGNRVPSWGSAEPDNGITKSE